MKIKSAPLVIEKLLLSSEMKKKVTNKNLAKALKNIRNSSVSFSDAALVRDMHMLLSKTRIILKNQKTNAPLKFKKLDIIQTYLTKNVDSTKEPLFKQCATAFTERPKIEINTTNPIKDNLPPKSQQEVIFIEGHPFDKKDFISLAKNAKLNSPSPLERDMALRYQQMMKSPDSDKQFEYSTLARDRHLTRERMLPAPDDAEVKSNRTTFNKLNNRFKNSKIPPTPRAQSVEEPLALKANSDSF